jgi:Spy/CpxP family protein refolding chaperone
MKRIAYAMLAAGLLLPGALPAFAQPGGDGGPGGGPRDGLRGRFEQKIEARMKKALDLSDEQETKLKDAFKEHKAAVKPISRKLRDLTIKLGDQVEDKAKDKDIQRTLDELKDARKAMSDEREAFTAKLAGFLTPTQRAKMLIGMERRMGRGGPGMMGHGRGRMGGRGGQGMTGRGRSGMGGRGQGWSRDDRGGQGGGPSANDGGRQAPPPSDDDGDR